MADVTRHNCMDTPSIAAEEEESDESQSALAFSHISLTEHQQNNQSTPIPVRENMKITNLSRQTAVSGVRVGANVAYEAQLLQDDQETVSFPPPSQPTITPHRSVKADEPTASPNTIGPLDNEAAVRNLLDGKSVPAHLLLKPTGAESSGLPLPQQEVGAQENDDGGTTDRPEEETAGLLQSPVEEVGHGLPTEGVVQRSTASGHGVLHSHHCRPPANKAAMVDLRSMVLHNPVISKVVSAVCRTRWPGRIRPNNVYPGSGFFVVYFGIYFFLTCCHNFLIKTKINSIVRTLEDRVLEKKIKWKCKRAVFHCSTKDLKSTVALPASVVLANFRDPVVVCDKVHDLLGILVNNPADFPRHLKPEDAAALIKIHPIPLQPTLMREPSLHTDLVIIAHFPCGEGHRAECVELALGRKYNGVSVCQDTLMVYFTETYKGSSGSPVLYVEFEESELGSVHRMSSRTDRSCKIGSIVNEIFVTSLRHAALKMHQIRAVLTRYDLYLQAF